MQSNYIACGCAASVTTAAMSDQRTGRQGDRDLFNRIPARLHRQPGAHTLSVSAKLLKTTCKIEHATPTLQRL